MDNKASGKKVKATLPITKAIWPRKKKEPVKEIKKEIRAGDIFVIPENHRETVQTLFDHDWAFKFAMQSLGHDLAEANRTFFNYLWGVFPELKDHMITVDVKNMTVKALYKRQSSSMSEDN